MRYRRVISLASRSGSARVLCAGVVAATAVGSLSAQTSVRPFGVPGVRSAPLQSFTFVSRNPCGPDSADVLSLARLPEGLALLRMRSELEAASQLQALRESNQASTAGTPVVQMRREVDSLARVIESVVLAAPRRGGDASNSEMAQRRAVTLRVRQLAPQVDQAVELALARVARPAPTAPSGYMGVTLSSVPLRQSLQAGYIVSYCEYPVIEAVDPGSPAERAGLQAGDTIVAFNGQDVRSGMVDYTSLLTPNANVKVRARRDGRNRDFTLRVAARPTPTPVRLYGRVQATMSGSPTLPARSEAPRVEVAGSNVFVFERPAPVARVRGSSGGQVTFSSDTLNMLMTGSGEFTVSSGGAWRSVAPTAPTPPAMMSFFANTDDAMLFGAQLKSLGDDLRAALSLPEGVLVLQVLRGTPASDVGLRDGDVIRSANGLVTRRVNDIRVAFERARDSRTLAMRVLRGNEAERTITLRW